MGFGLKEILTTILTIAIMIFGPKKPLVTAVICIIIAAIGIILIISKKKKPQNTEQS